MLVALLGLAAQLQWAGPSSGIITLNGPWRFQAGDHAAYAAPAFDDAQWDTLAVPGTWHVAGGDRHRGYGWYRVRVRLGAEPGEALAVRFRSVATVFEVFVDGERAGGLGRFPPRYRPRTAIPVVVPLPPAALRAGEHLIAVRAYSQERVGGIVGSVAFGPQRLLVTDERDRDFLYLATAFLLFGIGFTQVIFWLRRPHALEHLFIFLFATGLTLLFVCGMHAARLAMEPWIYWVRPYLAFAATATAAFLAAFRRIFQLEGDRVVLGLAVYHLVLVPFTFLLPEWHHLHVLSVWFLNPSLLLAAGTVMVIAVLQLRRGVRQARVLLWGIGLLAVALFHDVLVDWGLLAVRPTTPWMILLGSIAFMGSLAMTTAEKFADSESAALYDRLTGLYRREIVMDALQREIRRAARTRQRLAVIMLDVDRFKPINDTLGHQVGDRVLAEVGRRLGEAGRAVDWLGRYGGEEFVAVLASTDRDGAFQAAERLRSAVAALPIATGRTARTVTLSAGVTTYQGREEWPTTEELVGAADAALYRAKNAGRNCVRD